MKQTSRFPKDRGFEWQLGMELVKSVDEEKRHLVSDNQWDSSWATLRSFGLEPGKLEIADDTRRATVRRNLINLPPSGKRAGHKQITLQ